MKPGMILLIVFSLLVSCNGIMDYMHDIDGNAGSLSSLFSRDYPQIVAAPESFRASQARYPDKVRVSWDAVEHADYYILERSLSESGPFTSVGMNIYGEYWDDESVETGQKVWYRVRAYSREWEKFGPYTESVYGFLLGVPAGVNASKGIAQDHILVSWNAVEGAAGYQIYKGQESYPPNNPLRQVSGIETSVLIPISEEDQGVEFNFWVKSTNFLGEASSFSNFSMGFSLLAGAPPMPQNLVADQGVAKDSINLSWSASAGDPDYYHVFRWSSLNSQEERLTPADGTTLPQFTDADMDSLDPGVRYYYAVQAVKIDTADPSILYKSAFSEPSEGYLLSAPQDVSSIRITEGVQLSWSGVPGAETEAEIQAHPQWKYRVEYAVSQSGPFSVLPEVSVQETVDGRVECVHPEVLPLVYYRICTVNGSGVRSDYSELDEPLPGVAENLTVSCNSIPESGETPNVEGVFPVHISWSQPAGAVRYKVERASSVDGLYTLMDETTETVFVDTTDALKPGMYYHYRIIPYNSLNKAGEACSPEGGYGALTDVEFLQSYNLWVVQSSQNKLTLMHKSGLDALGSESKDGNISGTVNYNASGGLSGATVIMHYDNYCDFLNNQDSPGPIFTADGNSDTIIENIVNQSGYMQGVMTLEGMYEGTVDYSGIIIDGGAAAGGVYKITQDGRPENELDWDVLE